MARVARPSDTAAAPDQAGAGVRPTLTRPRRKRRKREYDTAEYVVFVRRILRALGRRVGEADLEGLAEMQSLVDELNGDITDAVARLRHDPEWPASWRQIGLAFGITRQAAAERFGKVGGRRRPGGQPARFR